MFGHGGGVADGAGVVAGDGVAAGCGLEDAGNEEVGD